MEKDSFLIGLLLTLATAGGLLAAGLTGAFLILTIVERAF